MKFVLTFFAIVLSALTVQAQTAAKAGIEDIYLAKDDGSGRAGTVVKSFLTTDIPIYCVVQLDTTVPVTVKMNLVAENVAGVRADTRVVTTSYSTKNGENRVTFSGRPAGKWTPGTYRADIFLDGVLVRSMSFEIAQPAGLIGKSRSFGSKRPVRTVRVPPKKPFAPFVASRTP